MISNFVFIGAFLYTPTTANADSSLVMPKRWRLISKLEMFFKTSVYDIDQNNQD
jgi:hypothetical protein